MPFKKMQVYCRPTMSVILVLSFWNQALLVDPVQGGSQPKYIPPIWRSVCNADVSTLSEARSSTPKSTTTSGFVSESPLEDSIFHTSITHTAPDGTILVNVTCEIQNTDSFQWKFMDLRNWHLLTNINHDTNPANRSVLYVISVHCSNGANVSLPWPVKTEGVREVYVDNCGLVDRDLLYLDPMVTQVANELQKLELRNCMSIVDIMSLSAILLNSQGNSMNISSAFDCGQDSSLEVYIRSNITVMSSDEFLEFRGLHSGQDNITDTFTGENHSTMNNIFVRPEDRIVTDSQSLISDHNRVRDPEKGIVSQNSSSDDDADSGMTDSQLMPETDILEFVRKILNTHSQCSYKKLRFQDESMTSDSFKYLLQYIAYGSEYPVLEVMNYSSVGFTTFPQGLHQWRLYFPRLRYIDLSHNIISEIKGEDIAYYSDGPTTILNVRYNNITTINMDVLNSWMAGNNAHIDARNNPIHCDCAMKSFIPFLRNASSFTDKFKQYEYIKVLKCHSPPNLQGRELRTLSVSSLSCPTFQSQMGWIIALSVALAIFVILTIILFRFKAEIRILLYTRLSIRMPWDADSERNTKMYDAFVSYSNEDARWVYQNIAALLESPEPTPATNGKSPSNNHPDEKGHNNNNNNNSSSSSSSSSSRKWPEVKGRFKLCLHQRDFIAGMTIMDNILDSIEASRHTIVVLSPSFMKSHWAMEELRQAYKQSLMEKTKHLIVVLLEKISDADMDPLIKRCCKTFTYLEVHDSIFKDRLIFSLTTKDRTTKRRDRYANAQPETQNHDIESCSYDNHTYDAIESERPPPPSREFSNMSTSSSTYLTQSV